MVVTWISSFQQLYASGTTYMAVSSMPVGQQRRAEVRFVVPVRNYNSGVQPDELPRVPSLLHLLRRSDRPPLLFRSLLG